MIIQTLLLFLAGIVAGLLQSITGLASLVSYPALLFAGLSPVSANINNTIALIFSGVGSILSSLKDLKNHWKTVIIFLIITSFGSIVGSFILIEAPAKSFEKIVPFFVLAAGILLIQSNKPKNQNDRSVMKWALNQGVTRVISLLALGVVGIYNGYFGAAGGIMFLAILSSILETSFASINATKNLMTFVGNLIAGIVFIFRFPISWETIIILGVGLFIGGFIGPIVVRHVNIHLLRNIISLLAIMLAVYLFVTAYKI